MSYIDRLLAKIQSESDRIYKNLMYRYPDLFKNLG